MNQSAETGASESEPRAKGSQTSRQKDSKWLGARQGLGTFREVIAEDEAKEVCRRGVVERIQRSMPLEEAFRRQPGAREPPTAAGAAGRWGGPELLGADVAGSHGRDADLPQARLLRGLLPACWDREPCADGGHAGVGRVRAPDHGPAGRAAVRGRQREGVGRPRG